MQLSIIIPVYNEATKIGKDIQNARIFFQKQQISGEIIIVDDGSEDETVAVVKKEQQTTPTQLNLICSETHRGKGHAVRTGMLQSRADYVMFIDSGSTVPFDNILPGLNLLENGECELAHGSRKLPASEIVQSHKRLRQFTSWLFSQLLFITFHMPTHLTDTQCGLKMYRGDVGRQIYAECQTEGFMFDIEIIMRAIKHGYRIQEFPIEWHADRDSRLRLNKMPWQIIRDLWRIKRTVSGK